MEHWLHTGTVGNLLMRKEGHVRDCSWVWCLSRLYEDGFTVHVQYVCKDPLSDLGSWIFAELCAFLYFHITLWGGKQIWKQQQNCLSSRVCYIENMLKNLPKVLLKSANVFATMIQCLYQCMQAFACLCVYPCMLAACACVCVAFMMVVCVGLCVWWQPTWW